MKELATVSALQCISCTEMNVLRPASGYWTKVVFGRAMAQGAFAGARPSDRLVGSRSRAEQSTKYAAFGKLELAPLI